MASSSSAQLTIVGNRPEPWGEFTEFMKGYNLDLHHASQGSDELLRRVLVFHSPLSQKITDVRRAGKYDSVICEGLFEKESWPLLAELLKDIATQRFESLGLLLQNPSSAATVHVKSAKERHDLKDQMVEHLKKLKVRTTIADRCYQVVEEMLMNAIYDAPMDKLSGKNLFNHLSRKDDVHLSPEQYSILEYGIKGHIVAVSVTDPFGGLTRDTLIDYLESCYSGVPGEMNEKLGKGGAGRGLHQIVENADLTVFQVKRGEKTRVVSYFWQKENPFGESPQLSFTYFD